MSTQSYQDQAAKLLMKYVFSESYIPFVAIAGGSFTSKLVFEFSELISFLYFKSYSDLSITQRAEWNSRATSTVHAIFITAISLYLVFFSSLFFEENFSGVLIFQSSALSTFALGISVGYFIADLALIFEFHPDLGAEKYVMHHFLSLTALFYAMMVSEGQLYTYMVLISEATTPFVNLRWYLDIAEMKKSKAYLINGVVIFATWLVVRILWFVYIFYHVYLHFDQVKKMYNLGLFLLIGVLAVLSVMNLIWFGKIFRGMMKTILINNWTS